ncbi:MAG: cytochrome c oxidase assembly protein [Ilumatobacteraceae bacterium]|nr:cytochrome c oxidase assembly protein [Ilumatobacteraceae bacterium]
MPTLPIIAAGAGDVLISPWRFQAHPEVWVLVAFIIGAWWYAIRVIGPQSPEVRAGQPLLTRRQMWLFAGAVVVLWLASDWPVHDISEEYLYSVHMFQHMTLSYFLPPLVLLATPAWLFRAIIGAQRAGKVIRWLTKPVIAGVLFNVMVMVIHIPNLVNQSVSNPVLHYSLHISVVAASFFMWTPVVAPDHSMRIGYGGRMVYLFLMSVVPTVPAAWLTFAEGVVYKQYDIAVRVWGMSVTTDQQLAGAVMKLGGSIFLWSIIVFLWFKRFMGGYGQQQSYRRTPEHQLTYDEVAREFERVPAAPEPTREG